MKCVIFFVINVTNMSIKHLITGGCSFTSHERVNIHRSENEFMNDPKEFWYYPHWIQDQFSDMKVHNMGSPGSGNLSIARSVIYKINELLNSGIKGEDLSIIVEWSNFHRKSYFVSKNLLKKHPLEPNVNYATDWIKEKKHPGEKGYWLTCQVPDMSRSSLEQVNNRAFKFNQNYLEVLYNDEERFIEWLEYFHYLITLCENKKIKLKCFFMHNPFSPKYHYGMMPWNFSSGKQTIDALFVHKRVENNCNETESDLFEKFPYSEGLYKMIDWSKYCWFFNEENIHKNGGILEWTIRNQITSTYENFVPLYQEYQQYGSQSKTEEALIVGHASYWGHTSSENYKKFTEEVILNWGVL